MEKKTIGKFISALRRASGMTQKELGEKLYVSDKTVSRWERDECTPELSLIPAIAEIFGITTDELLRGERRSETAGDREAAPRLKAKSGKQFRAMLHRRLTRFRNLSLIAAGIALLGLIAACIADLGFTKALIGFCLGLVFLLAAAICQLCFASSAMLQRDEEDDSYNTDILQANGQITRTTVSVFTLIFALLAFLLPLLAAGTIYGMSAESWMLLGVVCVAAALIAGHLFYTFFLRQHLVWRGLLTSADAIQAQQDQQLCKKLLKRAVPISAALALAIFAVNMAGWNWLAKPEIFDNYADFEAYMYRCAYEDYRQQWEDAGFQVAALPEGYLVTDSDGFVIDSQLFATDTVTDQEGHVLATYVTGNASRISFSFDKSADGLPVRVYSAQAMRDAYGYHSAIQVTLMCGIGLTFAVCAVIYLIRRRKKTA